MRKVLRFLFSKDDAAQVDPETIVVQDAPYAASPVAGKPYPQSMDITFSLASDKKVAPQVRPLFPGTITFLADDSALGEIPEPSDVALTDQAYARWKTRGTLMVTICRPGDLAAFRDHFGGVEVVPTIVWYRGIVLTKEFLFTTLLKDLDRVNVCKRADGDAVPSKHADWPKHAISGFLKGRYRPNLSLGATAEEDDVTKPMPIVADTGSGLFRLIVSCAARGCPQDARQAELDDLAPSIDHEDPAHPANGAIPARHVYRLARRHLIDGSDRNVAAKAILADWPSAPRYFTIRCTRTWRIQENVSIHFPQQRMVVKGHEAKTLLADQRLPIHGVFYLAQPPGIPPPSEPHIDVSFHGDMRWINGKEPHVWRKKAKNDSLEIDFSEPAANPAHIQLRLPMSSAIVKEPFDAPGGAICTYLSMRRSLRALIDNRITGGRLNFGRGRTSRATSALIDDAWSATGSELRSRVVANNHPPILVTVQAAGTAARGQLLPIWEVFFPEKATQVEAEGNGSVQHTLGRVVYEIWQSNPDPARNLDSRNNYPDEVVGRGAPGALVVCGLATAYAVDGLESANDSDETAYLDRLANEIVTALQTGAVLQFWNQRTDFDGLRAREVRVASYGHSLIYRRNLAEKAGIQVIDQGGTGDCLKSGPQSNQRIEWLGKAQDIWIAANWDE